MRCSRGAAAGAASQAVAAPCSPLQQARQGNLGTAGQLAGCLQPAAATAGGGRTFRLVLKRPSRGFCAGSSFFLGGICREHKGRT